MSEVKYNDKPVKRGELTVQIDGDLPAGFDPDDLDAEDD